MVKLEANKVLRSLISVGEIPQMIREMYDKYQIDNSRLLWYARRRNRQDDRQILPLNRSVLHSLQDGIVDLIF